MNNSRVVGWASLVFLTASCSRPAEPVQPAAPLPPPARDTHVATYDLQEKCAKDSYAWYKREWEDVPASNISSSYTNHYNSKLNRCYVLVASTVYGKEKKTAVEYSMHSKTLVDVLEHRDIGSFDQSASRLNPIQCGVGDARCTSEDEFDALTKPYMED